jgi:hypothetical protein
VRVSQFGTIGANRPINRASCRSHDPVACGTALARRWHGVGTAAPSPAEGMHAAQPEQVGQQRTSASSRILFRPLALRLKTLALIDWRGASSGRNAPDLLLQTSPSRFLILSFPTFIPLIHCVANPCHRAILFLGTSGQERWGRQPGRDYKRLVRTASGLRRATLSGDFAAAEATTQPTWTPSSNQRI